MEDIIDQIMNDLGLNGLDSPPQSIIADEQYDDGNPRYDNERGRWLPEAMIPRLLLSSPDIWSHSGAR
jgi:hypothetical protein